MHFPENEQNSSSSFGEGIWCDYERLDCRTRFRANLMPLAEKASTQRPIKHDEMDEWR
ncbi:hypothetical protein THTE_3492 [Thermogutta terrifontis]|uniref:Uncharacterized protein n=1 Tax=Thermogutta terrifontis TaxID=1331910 RepID=A0A286RJG0_9BACT|nr:hypothetical protein THTE_3492 [Thermogutta terrifontis]